MLVSVVSACFKLFCVDFTFDLLRFAGSVGWVLLGGFVLWLLIMFGGF